ELKTLFEKSHSLSSKFFKHIQNYNTAMAFASILSNIDNQTGRGPYVYHISDQIYHFVGSVKPASNEKPSFDQLYFLDTAEAREQRTHHPINICLNHELLDFLEQVILNVSPYAQAYKLMREVSNKENKSAQLEGRQPMDVEMIFDNNRQLDQQQYNTPQANEVAAIVVGSNDKQFLLHQLVIHPRASSLQIIPVINANCDPMSYLLLFPAGDKGWYPKIPCHRGRN
ncbi:4538_t:CDS:1, partial [Acaulospora morrowiae]